MEAIELFAGAGGAALGLEAAGIGLDLADGDVAVRCNFATLERRAGGLWVLDRRAGRVAEETVELASTLRDVELGDDIRASLHPATQHRAVLCMRGPRLSGAISDTDPGGPGGTSKS